MKIIHHDGDRWRILAVGATREDGLVYLHLASLTRWRQQRNGRRAIQIADWFEPSVLDSDEDADPITAYYSEKSRPGQPPGQPR